LDPYLDRGQALGALHEYSVRVSARAKRVRLTLSVRDGLVVVVPRGFNQRRIPELLKEKQRWLESALQKVEQQRRLIESRPRTERPDSLALRAIGEEWAVDYRPAAVSDVSLVEEGPLRLRVSGATDAAAACRSVLSRWLRWKAGRHLVPWLQETAGAAGLSFRRAEVRSQRTRWASYSERGTVSLNLKLLFLPPALVRYVLIHELCHTVHLNHSRAFWSLVEQNEPEAMRAERELKGGWQYVPPWLEPGVGPAGG
jgi:predicted metal-dependent hydrolase